MENKENKYFIKIKPEFLFDVYGAFDCIYTPWLYVQLKLKYNYFLTIAPHRKFKIDVKDWADFLLTTKSTIYDALNELLAVGLLEKEKGKYRILDEARYVTKFKGNADTDHKFPEFIKIVKEDFEKMLMDIKRCFIHLDCSKKRIFKVLRVYYYLIARNRHCLLKNELSVESYESETSLAKELHHDHKTIKFLLLVLKERGYINLEPNFKIYTINKLMNEKENDCSRNSNTVNIEDYRPQKAELKKVDDDKPKVPETFIGYLKSDDGKKIFVIYYNKSIKAIVINLWCLGDGVRPTEDERDIANDLYAYGKKSSYYDPNNFWKYKHDPEGIEKLKKF